MTITVFIRYELDPFKREQFEDYARRWLATFQAAVAISSAIGCRTRAPTLSRTD
jgi:hypothetical protein